ncbi:MAG: DUF4340 domain-containing protein [Acidobacteriota bacterium]|nr:DUF4340 domain-containing protein [Acidobacteriota bacterium]
MKFKTTLILLVVFILLLVGVILIEHRSERAQEKKEQEAKLTDYQASEVEKISLKSESGEIITIERDQTGHWQIIEPLEAEADEYEINSLVENFASLLLEKVVEEEVLDPALYEIPKKEVSFWLKGHSQPITIQIGMENPIDNTLYAKRADQSQVVLLPGHLKYYLDKTLFDLRKKDIMTFDTASVLAIELIAKENNWKVKRREENWYFLQPVEALASKSKIENLLDSLSHLRAKDFLAENKNSQNLKLFGLDKPEFTVILTLPESQEITFWLTRQDDKITVTNSLSKRIIEAESQIINDLSQRLTDLREKKVAVFNSWEAVALSLKQETGKVSVFKEKVKEKSREEEKWFLTTAGGEKEPVDDYRVESVLRNLEYLEATDFIDNPRSLAEYGLDRPILEITIRVRTDGDEEKELRLLVGPENPETHQVVIKNQDLPYLFRVEASFLKEIPERPEDWKLIENNNRT